MMCFRTRILWSGLLTALLVIPALAQPQASPTIALDKPPELLGLDLLTALKTRHSTKSYEKRDISREDLSILLWAANGVNRDNGKRTAPTPRGQYFVQIFVASDQGNYLYLPVEHVLKPLATPPIKTRVGTQPYMADASHILVLVANLKEYAPAEPRETILNHGRAVVGCMAQNVYLAAAARNLGAVLAASFDEQVARAGLALTDDQVPLYIVPVGVPKPE